MEDDRSIMSDHGYRSGKTRNINWKWTIKKTIINVKKGDKRYYIKNKFKETKIGNLENFGYW